MAIRRLSSPKCPCRALHRSSAGCCPFQMAHLDLAALLSAQAKGSYSSFGSFWNDWSSILRTAASPGTSAAPSWSASSDRAVCSLHFDLFEEIGPAYSAISQCFTARRLGICRIVFCSEVGPRLFTGRILWLKASPLLPSRCPCWIARAIICDLCLEAWRGWSACGCLRIGAAARWQWKCPAASNSSFADGPFASHSTRFVTVPSCASSAMCLSLGIRRRALPSSGSSQYSSITADCPAYSSAYSRSSPGKW